jgi:hypothetical protein
MDIFINFRTGYFEDVEVEMRPHKMVQNYLKFWFWIDAIGAFPFELFSLPFGSQRKTWKAAVKYIKLPKLFRITRIGKFLYTYYKYMYVLQIWVVFLTLCHWVACILGAIMPNEIQLTVMSDQGTNQTMYEALEGLNCTRLALFTGNGEEMTCGEILHSLQQFQSTVRTRVGASNHEEGIWTRYAICVRSAILMLTLSDSGLRLNDAYAWWQSFVTLLGCMLLSMIFGCATCVITMNVESSASYQEKVKRIMGELKSLEVPISIRKRTKNY